MDFRILTHLAYGVAAIERDEENRGSFIVIDSPAFPQQLLHTLETLQHKLPQTKTLLMFDGNQSEQALEFTKIRNVDLVRRDDIAAFRSAILGMNDKSSPSLRKAPRFKSLGNLMIQKVGDTAWRTVQLQDQSKTGFGFTSENMKLKERDLLFIRATEVTGLKQIIQGQVQWIRYTAGTSTQRIGLKLL